MPGGVVPTDPWKYIVELYDRLEPLVRQGHFVEANAVFDRQADIIEAIRVEKLNEPEEP